MRLSYFSLFLLLFCSAVPSPDFLVAQNNTSIWTGAAGNNRYEDAGNWTNGVPLLHASIDNNAINSSIVNLTTNETLSSIHVTTGDQLNIRSNGKLVFSNRIDLTGGLNVEGTLRPTSAFGPAAYIFVSDIFNSVNLNQGHIQGDGRRDHQNNAFFVTQSQIQNGVILGSGTISGLSSIAADIIADGGAMNLELQENHFLVTNNTLNILYSHTGNLYSRSGSQINLSVDSIPNNAEKANLFSQEIIAESNSQVLVGNDVRLHTSSIGGAGEIVIEGNDVNLFPHSPFVNSGNIRIASNGALTLAQNPFRNITEFKNIGEIILDAGIGQTSLISEGANMTGGGKIEMRNDSLIKTGLIHPVGAFSNEFTTDNLIFGNGKLEFNEFTNTGTIAATGGGAMQIDAQVVNNTGVLEAAANSTLVLDSTAMDQQGSFIRGRFKNQGGVIQALDNGRVRLGEVEIENGILRTSGSGEIQLSVAYGTTLLSNVQIDGNVGLSDGKLNLSGEISVEDNAILKLEGTNSQPATVSLFSDSAFLGSGTVLLNESRIGSGNYQFGNQANIRTTQGVGVISIAGEFLNTGVLEVVGNGNVMVIGAGQANNQGTIRANGGIIGIENDIYTSLSNYSGGTLIGGTWEAIQNGQILMPHLDIVSNQANIRLGGANAVIRDEYAPGTHALQQLTTNIGSLTLQNGASLHTALNLENRGIVTLLDPTSSLEIGGGSGEYRQTAGETRVDGILKADKIFLDGGTLSGTGNIEANLFNNLGTLAAGNSTGTMNIVGDLTQASTGTMEVEIDSLNDFDLYSISGLADLGGTLHINWANGYVPNQGDEFIFLQASLVNGTFDNVTSNQQFWQHTINYDQEGFASVTFNAIPEPTSAITFLAGLSCLIIGRRRRSEGSQKQSTGLSN